MLGYFQATINHPLRKPHDDAHEEPSQQKGVVYLPSGCFQRDDETYVSKIPFPCTTKVEDGIITKNNCYMMGGMKTALQVETYDSNIKYIVGDRFTTNKLNNDLVFNNIEDAMLKSTEMQHEYLSNISI